MSAIRAAQRVSRGIVFALLLLCPLVAFAHDVPDLVRISVFLKPVNDRMLILVRMPANALIDFIFPLTDYGYLDLKQAEYVGTEGARVWIAEMLSMKEGDTPLAMPEVRSVRIGRPNDPYFNSFQEAMNHVNGDRLPLETLATQDQITVDASLDTPIKSAYSNFSLTPRFSRVGVVVKTAVTFLAPDGAVRQFEYEGDPKAFELNPTASSAASLFVREGIAHFFGAADYLLFVLCVALAFRQVRLLVVFAATLACMESVALIASLEWMYSAPWIPVMGGILVAGATVYMGIEAIIGSDSKRTGLAVGAGLITGAGFWFELQPIVQFGGAHRLISGLAFGGGIILSQLLALALIFPAVLLLLKLSHAPRALAIIGAAIAIHVSWHLMLDRGYALTLVPITSAAFTSGTIALAVGAGILVLSAASYLLHGKSRIAA